MLGRVRARRGRDSRRQDGHQLLDARWLLIQRLARVGEPLERTGLPVDLVAERSGLGTAPNLRARFAREFGLSPTKCRRDHNLSLSAR